jgi:hypothetical protein
MNDSTPSYQEIRSKAEELVAQALDAFPHAHIADIITSHLHAELAHQAFETARKGGLVEILLD